MHWRQPLHFSGSTFATYSARNITGNSWVTVAFIAMQSERSQLQRPPMKGVWNVQTVWHSPSRSCSRSAWRASSFGRVSNPEVSGPVR